MSDESGLPSADSQSAGSAIKESLVEEGGLEVLGNLAEAWPIVAIPLAVLLGAWYILKRQPEKSPWRAWLRSRRGRENAAQHMPDETSQGS